MWALGSKHYAKSLEVSIRMGQFLVSVFIEAHGFEVLEGISQNI
jgi:hypothetical protein